MIFRLKARKICKPEPRLPHKLFAITLRLHSYCTTAILPSNSKRLFPIIMQFNAIRMVIRLQMKYLHDTVMWVHECGEVRKAVGETLGRAEWLQPDLGLICKTSSCPSLGCWRAGQGVWETLVDSVVVRSFLWSSGMIMVKKTLSHNLSDWQCHTPHIHCVL